MSFWSTAPTDVLNLIRGYEFHMALVEQFDYHASDFVVPFMSRCDAWEETESETREWAHELSIAGVEAAAVCFPLCEADSLKKLTVELSRKVDRWVTTYLEDLYHNICQCRQPYAAALLMACGENRDIWCELARDGHVALATGIVWDESVFPVECDFVEYRHVRDRYALSTRQKLAELCQSDQYVTNS